MKIPARLTSRKFWLTVGGAIVLIANNQWTELVALISAYMLAEGAKDVVEAKSGVPMLPTPYENLPSIDDDEDKIDTSKVVTGNDTPLFDEELDPSSNK